MIDPSNSGQVKAALAEYFAARPDVGHATIAEGPAAIGRGSTSFIYGLRLSGDVLPGAWSRPLVLRVERDAGEAYAVKVRSEAAVQRFVTGAGYPALESLATEDAATPLDLPFIVLPRVMGPTMFERIVARPWQARALLRQLAALHARLHRLPLDGCSLGYERPSSQH